MISTRTIHPLNSKHYLNSPFREDLYVLLSYLLLQPPEDDFLKHLAKLSWEKEISSSLSLASETLRETAECCSIEGIEIEFDNLFIGMGRGEIVPYASWYGEKLMMGAPLVQLRRDLAKLGICRQTDVFEPEDHAAALFETMALITRNPNISQNQQTAFFCRHIHPWMIRFFQDLQQAPSARFYRSVGSLGEHFLRMENQHLQTK